MLEVKKLITSELTPPLNVTVVHDEAGLGAVENWLLTHPEFGFDLETVPLKAFFMRKTRLIQVGDRDKQWVIDLRSFVDSPDQLSDAQGNYGARLHEFPRLHAVIQRLRPFLESHLFLKVGVNLGFEYQQMYWGFGVRPYNFFDCQMVERVIQAGRHSLKDYDFFSMESLMERYFGVQIDKELQTSFDIDNVLTPAQYEYAALDTRFPFPIRKKQLITGDRDKLLRVFQLENSAIGSFAEMHVHGEALDITKWTENTDSAKAKRNKALQELDAEFLKHVPNKNDIVTDAMVEAATAAWKKYNEVTSEELAVKAKAKQYEKEGKFDGAVSANNTLSALVEKRKAKKEELKAKASALAKQRTLHNKLVDKCQGNALINYDSNAQVYKVLVAKYSKLKKLASTNDEELNKFADVPVIASLRDYREWDKRVTTYGEQWVKEWITHPCNDEGWLSPYTHLIHSVYNQLMAETGRTSSDNPNGQNLPRDKEVRQCFIAGNGLVYVTCDMSGAELRIIAELSGAKIWIEAFARGEDVHSICTEIIFPNEWKADALPNCAYYAINPKTGEPARQKCKCPKHSARRDVTKTLNFGIAYGMEARTLSVRASIPLHEAEHVFARWIEEFSEIWKYLQESGIRAKSTGQARDMFGRRRSFPEPTPERAREKYISDWKESLKLPDEVCQDNIEAYFAKYGVKPKGEVKFWLTHQEPTQKQIIKAMISMQHGIERQGKNHCIQATNASIIKIAMGSGVAPDGTPYLFHTLPTVGARLIKMIHDEVVIRCKPEVAEEVAKMVGTAFKNAAAEVMKKVVMDFEYAISPHWSK